MNSKYLFSIEKRKRREPISSNGSDLSFRILREKSMLYNEDCKNQLQSSIELLERENEILQQEIEVLQNENKQLQERTAVLQQNVIIETFEGENLIGKWFKESDDEEEDETSEKDERRIIPSSPTETTISNTESITKPTSSSLFSSAAEEECIMTKDNDWQCPMEPDIPFSAALRDRALWLVGLLILQSFSGLILARNEALIQRHPIIVYFLTMLVGAGGNAGNQASVRVIRGLALGTLNEATQGPFLSREVKMAGALSAILGVAGFGRAVLFHTPLPETIAVTVALGCIVLSSVCLGAVLPLLLKRMGVDPAHSSTTIQVVMDVLGVFLTVLVSTFVLDSPFGQFLVSSLT